MHPNPKRIPAIDQRQSVSCVLMVTILYRRAGGRGEKEYNREIERLDKGAFDGGFRMSRSFFCPHCRKLLNPRKKVIFLVEDGNDLELVLLSAHLGDYSAVRSRSMQLVEGAAYTFRCPLCRVDLTSSTNNRLVDLVTYEEEDSQAMRVSFSRVHGEEATFLMAEDGVSSFGSHANLYEDVNFFGEAKNNIKD